MKETEYVEGKKHGLQTCYDPDGNPVKITTYENNIRVYEDTFYKGQIVSKTGYFNGKKEGLCELFEKGVKFKETNYANGKKDGLEVIYYPSGSLKSKVYYENGKSGDSEYYYSNGNLQSSDKNGLCTAYDSNGIPLFQTQNENEKYIYKGFYQNGNVGYCRINNEEHFYDPEGHEISRDEYRSTDMDLFVDSGRGNGRAAITQAEYVTKRDKIARERITAYRKEIREFGRAWTKPLEITEYQKQPIDVKQVVDKTKASSIHEEQVCNDANPIECSPVDTTFCPEQPKIGFWRKLLTKLHK